MLNALMNEHQPATETQHMLVETMAVTRWRLIRNWEMQRLAFEWDAENHGGRNPQERVIRGIRETGPLHCHQLLLRYEVALDRQFNKALRELQHLQSPRNTPPAKRTQEVTEIKVTPIAEAQETPAVRYATATPTVLPINHAHLEKIGNTPVETTKSRFTISAGASSISFPVMKSAHQPTGHSNS